MLPPLLLLDWFESSVPSYFLPLVRCMASLPHNCSCSLHCFYTQGILCYKVSHPLPTVPNTAPCMPHFCTHVCHQVSCPLSSVFSSPLSSVCSCPLWFQSWSAGGRLLFWACNWQLRKASLKCLGQAMMPHPHPKHFSKSFYIYMLPTFRQIGCMSFGQYGSLYCVPLTEGDGMCHLKNMKRDGVSPDT